VSTVSLVMLGKIIEAGIKEADRLIKNNGLDDALEKVNSLVNEYDKYYGITPVDKSGRATTKEDEAKMLMLEAHIKIFEIKYMMNQLNLNTLDLDVLENSIDLPVSVLEKELRTYNFTNKKNQHFKEYIAIETCRRTLAQQGAIASLRRITYYKMRTLTKLRFAQVIHQPSLNIFERVKALLLAMMLVVFWATSDFGQNVIKFFVTILTLLVSFGLIYGTVGNFNGGVMQQIISNRMLFGMHVSVTTFFTLGAYNILPADLLTSVIMSIEYIFGYFYLGLFVAILIDRVIN
jgi:hypothetical protein